MRQRATVHRLTIFNLSDEDEHHNLTHFQTAKTHTAVHRICLLSLPDRDAPGPVVRVGKVRSTVLESPLLLPTMASTSPGMNLPDSSSSCDSTDA